MPIKTSLPSNCFNPEVITLMAVAFEKTCRSLQISGQAPATEAVAKTIIELARSGERDPLRMSEWTLKNLQTAGLGGHPPGGPRS